MSFSESPISSAPDSRGSAAYRAVLKALATALALALAAPAAAGWQSTRWNMAPEEVAAAMAGEAPLSRGSGRDRLGDKRIGNVGTYRLGNARFRSVYYYDDRGLAHVALYRTAGDCRDIYASIAGEHGAPVRTSDQLILRLFIWHDRAAANRIRLLVSNSLCDLNYERLADYEAHDLSPAPRR